MATVNSTCNTPPSNPPKASGPFVSVDQLLRDRSAFFRRLDDTSNLTSLARALIITTVVGCGIFGASIGAYRGGIQIVFAAIKLPLTLLLTAGITAPAVFAVGRASGGTSSMARDVILVLSALAMTSLVVAGLAPVMLYVGLSGVDYHSSILVAVTCCAFGGAFGLGTFLKGLMCREAPSRALVALVGLLVFASVATQMTWTFRPYLVRPRTTKVPFMRSVEDNLLNSVTRSMDSARGVYHRPRAPSPQDLEHARN